MRVAIVGAGLIGRKRAVVIRERADCELLGVVDVDRDRATDTAKGTAAWVSTEWRDAVESAADIIVVATPNKFAPPIVIAAACCGKHVLCEKPLGTTVAEAAAMVDAARRRGVKLKTGFNHRHHPAIQGAYRALSEGRLGEPLFVRAVYGHGGRPGYDQEWRGDAAIAGGGELLDQGVHLIDLSRWFLGDLTEVRGTTPRYYWQIGSIEDNCFAHLRTASGKLASIHTSWTQWRNRFSFEVFGCDGYASVEGLGGSYGIERLTIGRRRPESGAPIEETFEFPGEDESWRLEWDEFVTAIRENREPLANGEDGLAVLRLVHAIYASAAEPWVPVPTES